jgi:hypothetical protein
LPPGGLGGIGIGTYLDTPGAACMRAAMHGSAGSLGLLTALGLALAACAAQGGIELGEGANPRAARARLAEAAATGPVRLALNAPPATTDGALGAEQAAKAAAEGVRGLKVRFSRTAPGPTRLVLLFDPPTRIGPAAICAADRLPAAAPRGGVRLHAVFCDGPEPIADAVGESDDRSTAAVSRLIWRTTARLFPDDYADTYGFNLFGLRVGLGASFGF